jgi:hypothetical protein
MGVADQAEHLFGSVARQLFPGSIDPGQLVVGAEPEERLAHLL